MIPWIQVYSNITDHDKTYSLAEKLKITQFAAVGIMVSLWAWASVNAPDGDVTSYPPRAIAKCCGWTKKAEPFYENLLMVRLLEAREDGTIFIRNWDKHEVLLIDSMERQRAKTRERVKRYRERKKADGNEDECNVTVTDGNAPTVPNRTLPYLTVPNLTVDTFVGDGGDARASGELVEGYLTSRGLTSQAFLGMTEAIQKRLNDFAETAYFKFSNRAPTDLEVASVYLAIRGENGDLDKDKTELFLYAFEQSSVANCPGDWRYMDGVLSRLHQRGIVTLAAAEEFDMERG